jgi:hypothetical protein
LNDMKPWYSFFTRGDLVSIALLGVGAIGWAMLVWIVMGWKDTNSHLISRVWGIWSHYWVVAVVGIPAIGALLARARHRLFPIGVFALGRGKDRHKTLDNWRWNGAIGIGGSILVSLLFMAMQGR